LHKIASDVEIVKCCVGVPHDDKENACQIIEEPWMVLVAYHVDDPRTVEENGNFFKNILDVLSWHF